MTLTRIDNGEIAVAVADLGAEMQSLLTKDGRQWLWQGDPAFWSGRSPILFPIVGKAPNDTISVGGTRFHMAQHGFARRSGFMLIDQDGVSCRHRLESSEASRALYPFEFQLEVEHRLDGRSVIVTAEVTNRDRAIMPFGIGFHPAFVFPLPGGEGREHIVELDGGVEPALHRLSGGLVDPHPLPSPFEKGRLVLDTALFERDAMLFPQGAGAQLRYGAEGGPAVDFGWENLPNLALWSKPGAPFVCLEPWHGTAATAGGSDELAERPYSVLLGPGATSRHSFRAALVD